MVQPYLTSTDFKGTGLIPLMSAVSTAIPPFWAILVFIFWVAINAASYFSILKLTGKKRFFHTFVATSFVMFLVTLVLAVMNLINDIVFISGYWVAFYILMTVLGWFMLENYK